MAREQGTFKQLLEEAKTFVNKVYDPNPPQIFYQMSYPMEELEELEPSFSEILFEFIKEKVKYSYNWLQKHNCTFGPFAIALYGIMTPEDEKEIVKIVKSKVSK